MTRPNLLTAILILALGCPGAVGADKDAPAPLDLSPIHREAILAHLNFLASEELEGRDTASRGTAIAARYIAGFFQSYGLQPAVPGEGEAPASFYQKFGLDTSTLEEVHFSVGDREFRIGGDFAFFAFSGGGDVEAEIVFCGYGITAPEYDYDDYAGVDVRGKIALVFRHEPLEKSREAGAYFQGARNSRHAFFQAKFDNARKQGAAAMLLVNDPLHCRNQRHAGVTRRRAITGLHKINEDDKNDDTPAIPSGGDKTSPIPAVFAGKKVADFLSEKLDLTALQTEIDTTRKPASKATGLRARIRVRRKAEVATTWNVLGILSGSDPDLRDEYVVVGAHFDHEGVLPDGRVMNGANDNASGTAGVLLIAEALASQPVAPRRSVLFILFNGEEKGLLGSRYYVSKPVIPLERTVAMINMDMVGRSKERVVQVIGGAHSHLLDRISRKALTGAGISNASYETGFRVNARSDHYPFFRSGIPVLVFHSDDETDYHKPTDDVEKITLDPMQRILNAVATAVWEIANGAERPLRRKIGRY